MASGMERPMATSQMARIFSRMPGEQPRTDRLLCNLKGVTIAVYLNNQNENDDQNKKDDQSNTIKQPNLITLYALQSCFWRYLKKRLSYTVCFP